MCIHTSVFCLPLFGSYVLCLFWSELVSPCDFLIIKWEGLLRSKKDLDPENMTCVLNSMENKYLLYVN